MARWFIQLLNTALMAPQSCSTGACGKAWPVSASTLALNRATSFFKSSASSSVSRLTPFKSLASPRMSSK